MIGEHVEIEVHPGSEADLASSFPAIRELLLGAPGCTGVRLLRSVDRVALFLLVVQWDRLEDHTVRFAASDSGFRVREILGTLCVRPPRVSHYRL